jgi:hypothetical protein
MVVYWHRTGIGKRQRFLSQRPSKLATRAPVAHRSSKTSLQQHKTTTSLPSPLSIQRHNPRPHSLAQEPQRVHRDLRALQHRLKQPFQQLMLSVVGISAVHPRTFSCETQAQPRHQIPPVTLPAKTHFAVQDTARALLRPSTETFALRGELLVVLHGDAASVCGWGVMV